jgi:hypothetical protein
MISEKFDTLPYEEEILDANSDAGVVYNAFDEPLCYFFIASCVDAKKELIRQIEDEDYGELYEVDELVDERAENEVPYQTYIIWRLWVEFGHETDAYEEFGLTPDVNNLENVAQVQLLEYARRIISKALSETGY